MTNYTVMYINYTSGHGNGTLIIAPTGNMNTNSSFCADSMWDTAGTYQMCGVSKLQSPIMKLLVVICIIIHCLMLLL